MSRELSKNKKAQIYTTIVEEKVWKGWFWSPYVTQIEDVFKKPAKCIQEIEAGKRPMQAVEVLGIIGRRTTGA